MNSLKEAEARVISAEARHLRLCEALDRGEPVRVALRDAFNDWVKARATLEVERVKAAAGVA